MVIACSLDYIVFQHGTARPLYIMLAFFLSILVKQKYYSSILVAFFLEKIIFLEKIKIRVIFPGKNFFMENEDELDKTRNSKCGDWGKQT